MAWNTKWNRGASRRTCPWPLELEVELCAPGRCAATSGQLRSLAALLNEVDGVSLAAVEAYERVHLVRVRLTVHAGDPHDAHDLACTVVHDGVSRAGLGPAIVVATRTAATGPSTEWRMG